MWKSICSRTTSCTLSAMDAVLVAENAEDARQEGAGVLHEDRVGEGGLGAEVVVEQRLVDARLVGDLLGAGGGGALVQEDAVGGVEDALSGFGVVGGGWRTGHGGDSAEGLTR